MEKQKNFSEQELPEFIILAVSDIIKQYIVECDVKDKNIILRFSKFAENVSNELQAGMINAYNTEFGNTEYINEFLYKRKILIKKNYDLYAQLEHLSEFNIPDYAIDAIVISVNNICSEELSEIENRDFYCLFGENIIFDIQNYMKLEKIKQQGN